MPDLRYQYQMNEPFVNGIKDTVVRSTDANVHKRYVAYDLDIIEKEKEEKMTMDDRKY